MKHRIRLALVLTLGFAVALPGIAAAVDAPRDPMPAADMLSVSRDRVTVKGEAIRLGDLFSNTGTKADRVVEPAPVPGEQATFDVHRLAAIARTHGLTWQARSWSERVVIERASQSVSEEQIIAAVRAAVEREIGGQGRFDIEPTTRDLALVLPADADPSIKVENLRTQPNNGQFTATVVTQGVTPARRVTVNGRLHRMIEVPTLNRRLSPGDVIAREDIHWVTMRADRVNRNVVTEAERLIGMAPTRTLVAGKNILAGEVRPPRIVTKGSIVMMLLKTPHMVLTSKGRALEHGAKGDVIRVMNTQSKTIVEGEITASGTILVTTAAFAPTLAPQTAGVTQPARR